MGDWSFAPWGTDEAADWFARFWRGEGVAPVLEEIERFDPREQRYESLRAAAYLLQTLGIAYVWPADRLPSLKPALDKAIAILENFLAPPDGDWGFLDLWSHDPGAVAAVEEQIAALKVRRRVLA